MLATSQELAVVAWVTAAIAACPELVPLTAVVWEGQDFPERTYPYGLLAYPGSVEIGLSPGQWVEEPSEDLVTHTEYETTVSIQIVSKADDAAPTRAQMASSYVRELRARARSFVADVLREAQLAVRDVNVVPNVSRLQGRAQWDSRALIDITFGHSLDVHEQPGVIETVEVTAITTPATTPTGPQLVPA